MGFKSLVKTGDIVNKEFCYDELPNKLDIFDNVDCDVIEQYSTLDWDNGDAEPDFTYIEDGYYADDCSESEYKPYIVYKSENEEEIEDEENE